MRDLHPAFAPVAAEMLRRCNAKGVPIYVYCTWRSPERQLELWQQGRDDTGRRTPGGRVVTNAKPGDSKHNTVVAGKKPASEAFDAVPQEILDERSGVPLRYKLDWTPFYRKEDERPFRESGDLELLDPRWRVMVQVAEALEIEWAGRWTGSLIEYVHWQRPGKTLGDLHV